MTWNWQQPDWPDFSWNKARFVKAEEVFLIESGEFAGMFKHRSCPRRWCRWPVIGVP